MPSVTNILNYILPRNCIFCGLASGQKHVDLCLNCRGNLPWVEDRCYQCGLLLQFTDEAVVCRRCSNKKPAFDRLCALFQYQPPLSSLISGLKFRYHLYFGRLLGQLLAEQLSVWYKQDSLPQVIIPVPLSKARLKQRGYNQALELLIPISQQYSIPINNNFCYRTKDTKAQSTLSAKDRKQNLTKAFALRQLDFPYHHVAIVDDVVTTGSTVQAISLLLKKHGVVQIDVWCICRS